jgi:tetratricopeptide (TPR) repeat protein
MFNCIGKRNQAITLYKDILGTNPSHHASLLGLAKIYRSLEENKLAESLFKRALVINPSPSTYQLLGALYFNTGKLEESFKTFEDGLILESDNSELICSYSQVAGRLDKLLILEELAKRFEQNYCVRFSLANALSQHKQQLQNAFVHSTVSIELAHSDKSMFDAYTLHATILKDLKRFQEAAVIYEKASLLYPQTTSSWINLGAVMHLIGNYSRAKHYYLKAIALEPNNIVAKSNLDKLNKLNYARTSQK